MLHRVFGFADLTAGQVMVPRTELVGVGVDDAIRDVVPIISTCATPAFPSTATTSIDVVGNAARQRRAYAR